MERLDILNHSNDGFYIAAQDLKLRGPGELLGVRQSGDLAFQIGDVYADAAVLQEAAGAVDALIREDAELTREEHQLLRQHFEACGKPGINSVDFRSI